MKTLISRPGGGPAARPETAAEVSAGAERPAGVERSPSYEGLHGSLVQRPSRQDLEYTSLQQVHRVLESHTEAQEEPEEADEPYENITVNDSGQIMYVNNQRPTEPEESGEVYEDITEDENVKTDIGKRQPMFVNRKALESYTEPEERDDYEYIGMVDHDYITILGNDEDIIGNEAYENITLNNNGKMEPMYVNQELDMPP